MKVFVSHSTHDKSFVEEHVVDFLEHNGVATWYSPDDIASATEWEKKTRQALEECDWFLVVLTPSAVASSWVRAEVHWAMDNRPDRVIPILAIPCEWQDLHLMLRTRQLVFLNENLEGGKSRLLAIWEEQLRPVIRQKRHKNLIDEPILAVEDHCVSTLLFEPVVLGATRAMTLAKRNGVSLPKSIRNIGEPEIACVDLCITGLNYLLRSGELFALDVKVSESFHIKPIQAHSVKFELPAPATSTCLVYGSSIQPARIYRLIGCEDGSLCAFASKETKTPTKLIFHTSQLSILTRSSKSVFASGDVLGNVSIWSQSDLQQLASVELRGHIYSLINDSNRSQFVAAVGDGEIYTIDYQGRVSTRVKVANRPITNLIFANERLILISTEKTVGLWDLKRQKLMINYQLNSKPSSDFIRRGRFENNFLVGCDDGSLLELVVLDPASQCTRALF